MKLLDNQLNKSSLSSFGEEACRLLFARDFEGLANRFGYALAYDRDTAAAIEADLEHCLTGRNASHKEPSSNIESITVKYFKPNDTGLFALVECVVLVDKGTWILVELIVAKNGENMNLYLEDINAVAE